MRPPARRRGAPAASDWYGWVVGDQMPDIVSPDNPRIKALRRLLRRRGREEAGLALAEGVRLVGEALEAGVARDIYYAPSALAGGHIGRTVLERASRLAGTPGSGVRVFSVTEAVLAASTDTETPQGIVATVQVPVCELEELAGAWREVGGGARDGARGGAPSLVVILDRLQDPGNVGTIMRAAEAAAAGALVALGGTVDFLNPKVLRSAMGATFRLPLARSDKDATTVVRLLSEAGLTVVAAAPRASVACHEADLSRPVAVVVGNEGAGLSEDWERAADLLVSIPMPGRAESLNVAVATGILLYEVIRQRQHLT